MDDARTIEPVRAEVTVSGSVEDAFRLFTEEIGSWWPLDTHAMDADRATGAAIEPRRGGRVYEIHEDGTEADWGTVLTWDPPRRLVLSWKPNRNPHPPTEVEIRFEPADPGTRVELVHRGWERLGPDAESARTSYGSDGGWHLVLGRYASAGAPAG